MYVGYISSNGPVPFVGSKPPNPNYIVRTIVQDIRVLRKQCGVDDLQIPGREIILKSIKSCQPFFPPRTWCRWV